MPRRRKKRCCRALPGDVVYKPVRVPMSVLHVVDIDLDEYEALRLCDGEGLDQTAAGEQMGVSRGTVQRLLAAARHKIVEAIDGSHAIRIMAKGGTSHANRNTDGRQERVE